MRTVSIVNVTSYTALELLRLLAQHPEFVVTSATGRSAVGKRLKDVFPQLHAILPPSGQEVPAVDPALVISEEPAQADLAFHQSDRSQLAVNHCRAEEADSPQSANARGSQHDRGECISSQHRVGEEL